MNIKWNTVTWYSKLLSVIFFIAILPVWTFYLGMKYQEAKEVLQTSSTQSFNENPKLDQKNEILFLRRDDNILSLYVINANGSNERFIYRNNDTVNSNIVAAKWTADNIISFAAMKNGSWRLFSINSDGTNLKLLNDSDSFMNNFVTSQESRDKNLVVEDLYDQKEYRLSYVNNGVKTKIYSVNYSKCSGPCPAGGLISEASFSPDKNHVIFEQGEDIMIASIDGNEVKFLTKGINPDWN